MPDKKIPNRIPAAEAGRWQSWALPDVAGAGRVVASKEKQSRGKPGANESIEDVELDGLTFSGSMTAEQLHEIVQAAEQEGFDKGYRDGLTQGRDEGHKTGQQQGLNEMRTQLMADQKRFNDLAQALLAPVESQDQRLETLLLIMVERMTRAVVRRELMQNPDDIHALVRRAVNALPAGAGRLQIYLNPDDLARMETYRREQPAWEYVADESMQSGGVKIVTPDSVVDDTVERRLDEIIERFSLQQDVDETTEDEEIFARVEREPEAAMAEPADEAPGLSDDAAPNPNPEGGDLL